MKTVLQLVLKWLEAGLLLHLEVSSKFYLMCTIYYEHCTALNNKEVERI